MQNRTAYYGISYKRNTKDSNTHIQDRTAHNMLYWEATNKGFYWVENTECVVLDRE